MEAVRNGYFVNSDQVIHLIHNGSMYPLDGTAKVAPGYYDDKGDRLEQEPEPGALT